MRHNYSIGICCFLCFLVCQTSAQALGHPNPKLPVLVQEGDAVCIGRITQVEDLGPTQVDLGYRNSVSNQPVPANARGAVAEVAVQTVLKGKISQKSITVSFYKNMHQGRDQTFFTELAVGETDIIFLKTGQDGTHFSLLEPNSAGKSKITIGDAKIGPISAMASPLRTVLLVLTDVLGNGSKPVKMECLDRIGSVGFTLNLKSGDPSYPFVMDLMKSLNEPGASELKDFVNSRILPTVLKLRADSNAEVHKEAVYTAGRLQDADVLPTLAEMANKEDGTGMDSAAIVISAYKAPEAVRPLTRLLENENDDVRKGAAEALRSVADPLAVPFLLDHLDDPSPWAKYFIVTALYTATDTPLCPGPTIFQAKEDQYVSFWKKWATEHQEKVDLLRAQFLAPLPTKAVQ